MNSVVPESIFVHEEVGSTMKSRIAVGACLSAALLVGSALAAEALKSGLQKGDKLSPFNPLHCSGPGKDGKQCLV
jgi:hypothetical protein